MAAKFELSDRDKAILSELDLLPIRYQRMANLHANVVRTRGLSTKPMMFGATECSVEYTFDRPIEEECVIRPDGVKVDIGRLQAHDETAVADCVSEHEPNNESRGRRDMCGFGNFETVAVDLYSHMFVERINNKLMPMTATKIALQNINQTSISFSCAHTMSQRITAHYIDKNDLIVAIPRITVENNYENFIIVTSKVISRIGDGKTTLNFKLGRRRVRKISGEVRIEYDLDVEVVVGIAELTLDFPTNNVLSDKQQDGETVLKWTGGSMVFKFLNSGIITIAPVNGPEGLELGTGTKDGGLEIPERLFFEREMLVINASITTDITLPRNQPVQPSGESTVRDVNRSKPIVYRINPLVPGRGRGIDVAGAIVAQSTGNLDSYYILSNVSRYDGARLGWHKVLLADNYIFVRGTAVGKTQTYVVDLSGLETGDPFKIVHTYDLKSKIKPELSETDEIIVLPVAGVPYLLKKKQPVAGMPETAHAFVLTGAYIPRRAVGISIPPIDLHGANPVSVAGETGAFTDRGVLGNVQVYTYKNTARVGTSVTISISDPDITGLKMSFSCKRIVPKQFPNAAGLDDSTSIKAEIVSADGKGADGKATKLWGCLIKVNKELTGLEYAVCELSFVGRPDLAHCFVSIVPETPLLEATRTTLTDKEKLIGGYVLYEPSVTPTMVSAQWSAYSIVAEDTAGKFVESKLPRKEMGGRIRLLLDKEESSLACVPRGSSKEKGYALGVVTESGKVRFVGVSLDPGTSKHMYDVEIPPDKFAETYLVQYTTNLDEAGAVFSVPNAVFSLSDVFAPPVGKTDSPKPLVVDSVASTGSGYLELGVQYDSKIMYASSFVGGARGYRIGKIATNSFAADDVNAMVGTLMIPVGSLYEKKQKAESGLFRGFSDAADMLLMQSKPGRRRARTDSPFVEPSDDLTNSHTNTNNIFSISINADQISAIKGLATGSTESVLPKTLANFQPKLDEADLIAFRKQVYYPPTIASQTLAYKSAVITPSTSIVKGVVWPPASSATGVPSQPRPKPQPKTQPKPPAYTKRAPAKPKPTATVPAPKQSAVPKKKAEAVVETRPAGVKRPAPTDNANMQIEWQAVRDAAKQTTVPIATSTELSDEDRATLEANLRSVRMDPPVALDCGGAIFILLARIFQFGFDINKLEVSYGLDTDPDNTIAAAITASYIKEVPKATLSSYWQTKYGVPVTYWQQLAMVSSALRHFDAIARLNGKSSTYNELLATYAPYEMHNADLVLADPRRIWRQRDSNITVSFPIPPVDIRESLFNIQGLEPVNDTSVLKDIRRAVEYTLGLSLRTLICVPPM